MKVEAEEASLNDCRYKDNHLMLTEVLVAMSIDCMYNTDSEE